MVKYVKRKPCGRERPAPAACEKLIVRAIESPQGKKHGWNRSSQHRPPGCERNTQRQHVRQGNAGSVRPGQVQILVNSFVSVQQLRPRDTSVFDITHDRSDKRPAFQVLSLDERIQLDTPAYCPQSVAEIDIFHRGPAESFVETADAFK